MTKAEWVNLAKDWYEKNGESFDDREEVAILQAWRLYSGWVQDLPANVARQQMDLDQVFKSSRENR
jgi:hypothetical protein